MKKTVLIVNYNTAMLTGAAVISILKHTPDCEVVIFENTPPALDLPFTSIHPRVRVINNGSGQIIDFDKWLATFPDKAPSPENNYASAKHCKSVQMCFDLLPDGFVLMDSDILVKQDITPLFDPDYAWVGKVKWHKSRYGITLPRVLPFACWLNVPMLREHKVRYCNDKKMWSLSQCIPNKGYDTGCWFFEDCERRQLPGREINLDDYIIHLGHASWQKTAAEDWLILHKELWK